MRKLNQPVIVTCPSGTLRGIIIQIITQSEKHGIYVIEPTKVKTKRQWFWRKYQGGQIMAKDTDGKLFFIDTWPIS